jgi:hypothetical protein
LPNGVPIQLSDEVAGSLSRMQGILQAAEPAIEHAAAVHWLAARQAGGMPAFQQMTQQALLGFYATLALRGLLRFALTGQATTEVMGAIIDQIRLMQLSFRETDRALAQLLMATDARELTAIPMMVEAFRRLIPVYRSLEQPAMTVLQSVRWRPASPLIIVPLQEAFVRPM